MTQDYFNACLNIIVIMHVEMMSLMVMQSLQGDILIIMHLYIAILASNNFSMKILSNISSQSIQSEKYILYNILMYGN